MEPNPMPGEITGSQGATATAERPIERQPDSVVAGTSSPDSSTSSQVDPARLLGPQYQDLLPTQGAEPGDPPSQADRVTPSMDAIRAQLQGANSQPADGKAQSAESNAANPAEENKTEESYQQYMAQMKIVVAEKLAKDNPRIQELIDQYKDTTARDEDRRRALLELHKLVDENFLAETKTFMELKGGEEAEKLCRQLVIEKISEYFDGSRLSRDLTEEELKTISSKALLDYQIIQTAKAMDSLPPEIQEIMRKIQDHLLETEVHEGIAYKNATDQLITYMKDASKKKNLLGFIVKLFIVLVLDDTIKLIENPDILN